MSPRALITYYDQALRKAGYQPDALSPVDAAGRRTTSREAFEAFAQLKAAPEALALLSLFADIADLRAQSDFSASCLPGRRWPSPWRHLFTVSVGMAQVLFAAIDRSTGKIDSVTFYGVTDADTSWLDRVHSLDRQNLTISPSHLRGNPTAITVEGALNLELLYSPEARTLIFDRVNELRTAFPHPRRDDWHNPWLWGAVGDPEHIEPSSKAGDEIDEEWDVTSADTHGVTRRRTSQARFRHLLLEQGPQECTICGITLLEVLEAAHIMPHAEGGRASSENGRLLCANHHRAFDNGLYHWTGNSFTWVGLGDEPILGAR